MEDVWEKIYGYVALYGVRLLIALLIFIVGKITARTVTNILHKIFDKAKVDKTLSKFLCHLAHAFMLVFVAIAAINQLGIATTSLVAVLGAAGLAVGLALQGSLSNFAAGVLLIIFKPFAIGDLVTAGGVTGTVEHIEMFNTVIKTLDNRKVVIPNSKVTGNIIENLSAVDKRRVDMVFGISYSDDIKTAKDALQRVLDRDERILKEPKPVIAVSELGDSSVNLVCRPWVAPKDYWDVYFSVLENGKVELEKSGITIPFPQMDVHLAVNEE